jgi:hypothetical protein
MDMNTLINASDLDPKALSALRSNPRFKEIFIHEFREGVEEGEEGVMVPITYFWPKRPQGRRYLSGAYTKRPADELEEEDLCMDPKLLEMRRDQEEEDKRIQQLEAEYEEEENNSD